MPALKTAVVTSLVCVIAGVSATADIVEIGALKDNTLYEHELGALSNGAGDFFFAGNNGQGLIRRGLLAFDIAGIIPEGAIIESVSLQLHMSQTQAGDEMVSLFAMLADWGEGTSNAGGGEGGGAEATPGDATWLHTFFDTGMWDTPGGDFNAAASGSSVVGGTGFYNWESELMISDVQAWLDNSEANYGWMLRGNEELASSAKRFDTHENSNAEFRPVLIVEFSPVPAPGALALLGGIGLLGRRRRR